MRLLLIIFLGTITLIRRAQKSIFNRLEPNPSSLFGILPQDEFGFNLKNSVEEVCELILVLQFISDLVDRETFKKLSQFFKETLSSGVLSKRSFLNRM
jgi:hypothetical protein